MKHSVIVYHHEEEHMAKKIIGPKYKLLPKRKVKHKHAANVLKVYQIQAVRDIPSHGVKAGDLGGFVQEGSILSQHGNCWIKEGSLVMNGDEPWCINGNALIDGEYYIVKSNIDGSSVVSGGRGIVWYSTISDCAEVKGNVNIRHSAITKFSSIKQRKPLDNELSHDKVSNFITMMWCDFSDAVISGNGHIQKVSSAVKFKTSGYFNMWFNIQDNHSKVTLTQPFKACGYTEITTCNIVNSLVDLSGKTKILHSSLENGKLTMSEGAVLKSNLQGTVNISGEVKLTEARLEGENILKGSVILEKHSSLSGKNVLSGDTRVLEDHHIQNQVITGGVANPENNIEFASPKPVSLDVNNDNNDNNDPKLMDELEIFKETIRTTEEDYKNYTTDIVKLIKYPAMTDASVPETQELMVALRAAQRALKTRNSVLLEKTSLTLENTFVKAESNAYKLAATFLEEKDRAGLKRAENALAIALDENANEHERRAGYKSGMKSLEGILSVSEEAVFALKERIGLKEIEA